MAPEQALILPTSLVSRTDVMRLLRELDALENYLVQAKVRLHDDSVPLPRLSIMFELIIRTNNIEIANQAVRQAFKKQLERIQAHAPNVYISFATNPSAAMIEKLVGWFRRETHPYTLVQTGLQPGLAAGCMIRTPNHVFDLSLRRRLKDKSGLLRDALRAKVMQAPQQAPAVAVPTAPQVAVVSTASVTSTDAVTVNAPVAAAPTTAAVTPSQQTGAPV